MIKIFDCSNSCERPQHRGGLGPFTNEVVHYLKTYADYYCCKFVDDLNKADVLFTNDVFPKSIQNVDLPKVKRMDGVFFQKDLLERNLSLNESALISNHVIFISRFSKDSFDNLYGFKLKDSSVILNQVSPGIYFPSQDVRQLNTFISSATNWNREEKRLNSVIDFANLYPEFKIKLIGLCSCSLPNNIEKLGYMDDPYAVAKELRSSDAMINFSYKDACPKTVLQGVYCKLPILFANSGGVSEIVYSGVGIEDKKDFVFEETIPNLKIYNIKESGDIFINNYSKLREIALTFENSFQEMLDRYFYILTSF